MDKLIPALNAKLREDLVLDGLVSSIRYWRNPRNPEKLIRPVVTFRLIGFEDKDGHHGATIIPIIEIHVWAYDREGDDSQIKTATIAANRISDILCTDRLVIPGGGTTRIGANVGWQNLDEQDPNTIHLVARFTTSYWSSSRIARLTNTE